MQLLDAVSMHSTFKDSFEIPPREDVMALTPGDYAKVCADCERFWVEILDVDGEEFFGVVDNDLVCTWSHGLRRGDGISFSLRNVMQIEMASEQVGQVRRLRCRD